MTISALKWKTIWKPSTSADIVGRIGRWKCELRKNDISEDQANSLCFAASAFTEELSQEIAVFKASKALQADINSKEKRKSLVDMDVSDGFVPLETSIREIVVVFSLGQV